MLCSWEGLAVHWPRVTNSVVYPSTGSMAYVRETSTPPTYTPMNIQQQKPVTTAMSRATAVCLCAQQCLPCRQHTT